MADAKLRVSQTRNELLTAERELKAKEDELKAEQENYQQHKEAYVNLIFKPSFNR